eukprot:gb/GECG01010942.1/.p1 GENE.gb/GECG01010942.1/~~gb/GECG01010942.1/.p1  ORF type:complete len:355 (+),score=79.88 gb/GECG01010942.1/:1-1065(+)
MSSGGFKKGKKKLRKQQRTDDDDEEEDGLMGGKGDDDKDTEELIRTTEKQKRKKQKRGAAFGEIRRTSAPRGENEEELEPQGSHFQETASVIEDTDTNPRRNDATATLNIDTEDGREKYQQQMEGNSSGPTVTEDGKKIYQGKSSYTDYIKRDADSMHSAKLRGTLGPVRGPSHIRTTNQMDYEPSLCKDYYETGFCGYGDTCIYLHMRESYTPGWKQDQEWEEAKKKQEEKLKNRVNEIVGEDGEGEEDNGNKSDLPFACFLCRKQWSDKEANLKPVKTLCGHYFCEECALKRHKRDSSCAACNKETYGMFNLAQDIIDAYQDWKGERPAPAASSSTEGGGWGSVQTIKGADA